MFLLNLLLAIAWTALTADFTPVNFLIGFGLGYLAIRISIRTEDATQYAGKIPLVLSFVVFFLWELARASLRVAVDIVTPAHRVRPAVIAVPLDVRTDAQITLLASLITLTPGTLGLEVSDDRRTLYVHVMYLTERHRAIDEIKCGFERRILEVTT